LGAADAEVGRSSQRKRSRLRRLVHRVALVALLLIALPYAVLPLYASANPPVSAVMVWKLFAGVPMTRSWVDLDDISPHLVRAVLVSEDARFCEHGGVDWVEVRNALEEAEGRPRGASTITMQTVKNLFLWTGRSWIRKGLEVPLALYADLVLSKRRIMEIYLNVVEWRLWRAGRGGALFRLGRLRPLGVPGGAAGRRPAGAGASRRRQSRARHAAHRRTDRRARGAIRPLCRLRARLARR
jgi:hypothetical protein